MPLVFDERLTISGSPHIHTMRSTSSTMWHVVVALLPAWLFSIWIFGVSVVAITATSIVACVVTEFVVARFMLRRPLLLKGGSSVVTGLLLAMCLPSGVPLWLVAIGGVAAIGIGKMAFGGLGCNIFNPALVGRVFLLLSFPAQMTTWPVPHWDGATGATLLAQTFGHDGASGASASAHATEVVEHDLLALAVGLRGGSLGEVAALALITGFLFLLWRRIVSWHIPLAIVVTEALLAWVCGFEIDVEIFGGGLLLGALFMATDYVTSPMTKKGMIVFGVGIALITFSIRHWGAYPEGVSFAILIMNGFVTLIDRCFKPKKFGERRIAI